MPVELSGNLLQNLFLNLPPQTVVSKRNLKPFFKPKLMPYFFLLNFLPDLRLELVVEEEVGPPGDVAVRPHGDPRDRGQAREVDVLVNFEVLLKEQHGDRRVRHLRPVDKVDWRFSVLLN